MKHGTSIIFLNDQCQVLLLKRDNNQDIPFPNCWDVPGGMVEDGESPEQCIQREMKEEMELEIKNPVLFNTYQMYDRIEHTFWQKANFEINTIELHEGQYIQWFSEQKINQLSNKELAFGFKKILKEFFKKKIINQ